jgi:NAD(P)-dependent dehydrogenase (short-subunit alcohol dehydrogenase family)
MTDDITLVTGGGRGIGAAICRRLAAEGHDVVLTYLGNRRAANEVAADVRASGQRALVVQADVTDEGSIEALFEQIAEFGPLTGIVNNAASVRSVGRLQDADLHTIRDDLDTNLFSVLAVTKVAIPVLTASGGGAIVNISSRAATLGSANTYVHYAAAKAGVEALTVGLSQELAGNGIRVNAVAPGIIWTEFHRDRDRPAKLASTIPMGRAGQPQEIAGAVAWLLSDDASYATGTVLRVAGGL